jgi:hypothetical protein
MEFGGRWLPPENHQVRFGGQRSPHEFHRINFRGRWLPLELRLTNFGGRRPPSEFHEVDFRGRRLPPEIGTVVEGVSPGRCRRRGTSASLRRPGPTRWLRSSGPGPCKTGRRGALEPLHGLGAVTAEVDLAEHEGRPGGAVAPLLLGTRQQVFPRLGRFRVALPVILHGAAKRPARETRKARRKGGTPGRAAREPPRLEPRPPLRCKRSRKGVIRGLRPGPSTHRPRSLLSLGAPASSPAPTMGGRGRPLPRSGGGTGRGFHRYNSHSVHDNERSPSSGPAHGLHQLQP